MKPFVIGAAAMLLLGWPAWADDPPKTDPAAKKQEAAKDDQSPAAKFAAAKKAYLDQEKAFSKVINDLRAKGEELNLQTNETLRKAFETRNKEMEKVVEAAKEVVAADPKSDTGFDALTYVINMRGPTPDLIKILAENHVTNPKVGTICQRLQFARMNKDTEAFLRAVMEKNPSKDAKGQATMTLAQLMMQTDKAQAETLFEKIAAEYKDVKSFRGTLADRAESNLFELRNLQVGKVAPDIEGEDLEGKKFKLSDYRGKVVMLDFWGHW
jgi:hypothetical protein